MARPTKPGNSTSSNSTLGFSDTFEEQHARLTAGQGDYAGASPEDKDEYKAENVFWMLKEARWSHQSRLLATRRDTLLPKQPSEELSVQIQM